MRVFCICSMVLLLAGCTTLGGGNVKTSNSSEPIWSVPYNSADHSKAINKKNKAIEQENYDATIDRLDKLPEFILIRI